jgi:transposase
MTTERKLIMRKISLLDLAEELKNVSEACRIMRVSRDTFYRVKNAYEEEGMDGLREKTRRKPNLRNRVPSEVESAVLAYSLEHPTHGQVRVSDELRRQDVWVSPGGVRCIWLRAGVENRLSALTTMGPGFLTSFPPCPCGFVTSGSDLYPTFPSSVQQRHGPPLTA